MTSSDVISAAVDTTTDSDETSIECWLSNYILRSESVLRGKGRVLIVIHDHSLHRVQRLVSAQGWYCA